MPEPMFFEDLEPGMIFTTEPRILTEQDFLAFAAVSGDHHPLHVDDGYARQTEYGRRIAHGPFGIAMAIGLFATWRAFRDTCTVMTDITDWRFCLPMFIGDAIRLEMTVGEKRINRSGRGMVNRHFRLLRPDGSVPQSGSSGMVVLRRQGANAN